MLLIFIILSAKGWRKIVGTRICETVGFVWRVLLLALWKKTYNGHGPFVALHHVFLADNDFPRLCTHDRLQKIFQEGAKKS